MLLALVEDHIMYHRSSHGLLPFNMLGLVSFPSDEADIEIVTKMESEQWLRYVHISYPWSYEQSLCISPILLSPLLLMLPHK